MPGGTRIVVAGFLGALALAFPVSALAADTYVDQGTGTDTSNNCQDPANPCRTLVRGISQAGAGDTVFVEGGHTYTSSLAYGNGKSLIHKDFVAGAPGGAAILNNGTTATFKPDINITSDAGQIKGFTIRSGADAVFTAFKVTINQDVFDSPDASTDVVANGTGTIKIENSTFTSGDAKAQDGIISNATGKVVITDNTFTGFDLAIGIGTGSPSIRDNDISGIRYVGSGPEAISLGSGSDATVNGNFIHDAVEDGTHLVYGVFAIGPNSVTMTRNLISGFDEGIRIDDNPQPASLSSDVVMNTTHGALSLNDEGSDDPGIGDGNLVNETYVQNSGLIEVGVSQSHVNVDSSIIRGDGISGFGGGTCTITFSDGPASISGGNGCQNFQTTANPLFKADGYHLSQKSTMIDAGNPADPGAKAKDIDGDPRALDGPDNASCAESPTRDIGADEFVC